MGTKPDKTIPRDVATRRAHRALIAGSVGNFIEWYEFGTYGFLAAIIAEKFFSSTNDADFDSLIKTYASFAIAFLSRPFGAVLFGRLGDRIGRRPTLIAALLMMSISTTLIGLLPTYASIGAAAPLLMTLMRIVQGLSAGGEVGGAVSVMTEFAPPEQRGLYGAWQSFTVALGLLFGAASTATMATLINPEALQAWGWRIPFLAALPLGLIALWLRLRLDETPPFKQAKTILAQGTMAVHKPSTGESVTAVALGIGRLMGWSVAGYTFLIVLPAYLQTTLHASFREALIATALANLGFALTIIPAGAASDHFDRRTVMMVGMVLIIVFALPLFKLLHAPIMLVAKACAVFIAGMTVGLVAGPGPAMLAEMFPTTMRYTGIGLVYALSNALFAGPAGLIITALIKRTGNPDIPAYYVMTIGLMSAIMLATLRNNIRRST